MEKHKENEIKNSALKSELVKLADIVKRETIYLFSVTTYCFCNDKIIAV